ncbi:hypothetical protein DL96DRAFT_834825 [Flagelloscypha sp. PMI_526]|nr:hypothetical protein DL96DRAFT_834825 [Flagelloscypha sp. PMI_526]
MSATATVTKTATTAQLTAVALHTLDASHASVSVSWVTNGYTTYFGQYVVGETDAGGKFRTDRPIETWSANAFAQKFFEPGATGTSADRLVCESQVGVTLQPRPTTSLGYGVQECAQVHINPSNGFFTTTGSTTITPQPISTFRMSLSRHRRCIRTVLKRLVKPLKTSLERGLSLALSLRWLLPFLVHLSRI